MRHVNSFVLLVCALPWPEAPVVLGEPAHKLEHDVTDAFKMFEQFPLAIAIFDVDEDGDLDCLVTVRSNLDKEGHTVTYTWLLQGTNGSGKKNVTFNLREGASPDKPVFTPEDGGQEQVADFIYSDYKTCTVLSIPYMDKQECILWMGKEAIHDVPKECEEQYDDKCGNKYMPYDDETCGPIIDSL